MDFLRSLYFHKNFFYLLVFIAIGFFISVWLPFLFPIFKLSGVLFIAFFLLDLYVLYKPKKAIKAKRILPKKLSNSDLNPIGVMIQSYYNFKTSCYIVDELPVQFQKRDFEHKVNLSKYEKHLYNYHLRPVERGEYVFGFLNIYVSSPIQLIKRRYKLHNKEMVPVYPSIIQMQQYDLKAASNKLLEFGLKKIRRIGHSQEFEQIKEYIQGDDFRTINWKATAKKNQLMVNQYQDEKSQPVYCIIDTGRVMKMPFEGLKLLDYAINSTLAFSNIALKKNDKVGLITFSKKVESILVAQRKLSHLNTILEKLYNINTLFTESDFGNLFINIKRQVNQRSLILLFTNFEHISGLKRQLPFLKAIAKKHILVVIFFENTEVYKLINSDSEDIQNIYHKTIAEKFILDKKLIQKELQKHGIQTILTKPEDLTVNTINKYLEIKARGLF